MKTKIEQFRIKAGATQDDLAIWSSTLKSKIQLAEKNIAILSIADLRRISEALGISIECLGRDLLDKGGPKC